MSKNPFDMYDILNNLDKIQVQHQPQTLTESAKPDFLDLDKDGDTHEPMKQAAQDQETVDEMFFYDLPDTKKDRGPRDSGQDELARRAKLGKNSLVKHASDYKTKGDNYKIAGPKGRLPEGDEQLDEYFYFDAPKSKDRGPRDSGQDELARRSKLGKNPLVKHGQEYKAKGDNYKIAGPKGPLPEDQQGMCEQCDMPESKCSCDHLSEAEKWIAKAIKHPGALKRQLKVPADKPIPAGKLEKATHAGGKLGKRARLAQTLRSFHEALDEAAMTPKQKKFAALAEPRDKITYADKIAGAKKGMTEGVSFNNTKGRYEYHDGSGVVDTEDLTATQRARIAKWKKENPGKKQGTVKPTERKPFGSSDGPVREGQDDQDHEVQEERRERTRSGRHEIERTARGVKYTRVQADERDDDDEAHDKKSQKSQKSDKKPRKSRRNVEEMGYGGLTHEDHDGEFSRDQLHGVVRAAKELHNILGNEQDLPEWVQSKITRALEYINASRDYMDPEQHGAEMVDEKAVSQAQQAAAGIALAARRAGRKPKAGTASAQMAKMPEKELRKFAKTKHQGLPKHVKGKSVEEQSPATQRFEKPGSVLDAERGGVKGATQPPADSPFPPGDRRNQAPVTKPAKKAQADGDDQQAVAERDKNPTDKASKKAKSTSGVQVGKGIYDSVNLAVESLITEGMNISTSVNDQGQKNITVTASDQDAHALAELLMMAGLGQSHGCEQCGHVNCDCDHIDEAVDENQPDYPVNSGAGQDTEYMTQTIAGGLNRRKADITTLPATQVRAMEESVERNLWNLYKRFNTEAK